jgi:predicted permease
MRTLLRRLHYLLNRARFDRELADDLEFHREMAARHGNIPLGNPLRLREESRDAWGWTWIDRLGQDLRYAARVLRRSWAFTLAAVLMLAVGTGANVAVFGFFNLVVLRPLDVREPDSLLRFHRRGLDRYAFAVPYPEAAFFRQHARTLSAVIAVHKASVSIDGEEKPVDASFVTPDFFDELGGASSVGRPLDPARDGPAGADPVVVLGHGFWQRRFGGDPSIVGRTLEVNGKPATIVGVAAREFGGVGSGVGELAIWAPIAQQPYFVSGSTLLTDLSAEGPGVSLWGRIREGSSATAAEDELAALAAELRRQHPADIWEHERLPSEPGGYVSSMIAGNRRGTGAEARDPVYQILALVSALTLMILAVACGNLGSMLLARGVARQREIAIRVAVGVSRARLVRQMLTESLLLALLGAGGGLVLGAFVLRGLLVASGAPAWLDPTPDWRVAAFALSIGVLSAVLFGLTPALKIGREQQGARRARHVLIGAQVAASCVLLIVAGLLGRALGTATSSSPGFDAARAMTVSPGLTSHGYTPSRSRAYLETLGDRVRAIGGVVSVALALSPPLGRVTITAGADFDERRVDFRVNHVSAGFFSTMGIPILRGRDLRPDERHVVVLSEMMARQAWPGEDPLGKTLVLGDPFTVVGIAGNVRAARFGEPENGQAYFPIEDGHWSSMSVLVRTSGAPGGLARAVTLTASGIDPGVRPRVDVMSRAFEDDLQGAEYSALAVSALGGIAQLLACFGIVGVVSYAVSQRTREIGIRVALGARPASVLAIVLRHLSLPVAAGLAAGVTAAALLSQALRGRLYGVSHLDVTAYAGAVALFVVTAALAAAIPAQRALRVDPLEALRHE